jgi:ketosteroid isomerase-like protein
MTRSRTDQFLTAFTTAVNSHDPDEVAACFAENCEFILPVHPARGFIGRAQARENWTKVFAAVPDLNLALVDAAHDGARCWAEWEYAGTRTDGERHWMRGVTIIDVNESGLLRSARFFVDYVDTGSASISEHLESLQSG